MQLKHGTVEFLKNERERGRRFVCFGAGKLLKRLCEEAGIEPVIDKVFDNNSEVWGKPFLIGETSPVIHDPATLENNLSENQIFLITTVYYRQVYRQLMEMNIFDGCMNIYCFPNSADVYAERYAEKNKEKPLQDILVFRSGPRKYVEGSDFADNARVLFDYMLESGYNKKYQLVWMVKEPEKYEEYAKIANVKFVSYDWESSEDSELNDTYQYYMYFAKGFFFTVDHYWLRNYREGQLRVNLWHGCGFKDRKTKNGPTGQNYDYMLVISPLYAKIHAKEFGCELSQMLITGLPKQDLLFSEKPYMLEQLLGIKKTSKKIFWLPTFRMAAEGLEQLNEYDKKTQTGLPIICTEKMMSELDQYLKQMDLFLLIKLHPVQDNSIILHKDYDNIKVMDNKDLAALDIQINILLREADALISDYSSVAVDYMLLDRPIAFTLDDVEEYRSSRGFVFDNLIDNLPGKEIYSMEDFLLFIYEVAAGIDSTSEKRRSLSELMHTYHDGNSCKRLLDVLKL